MPEANRSRGLGLSGVAGVAISLLLLWWALHDVDFREVLHAIRGVRAGPFTIMVVLATLTFPIRAVRWRYLLQAGSSKFPFAPMWHATAIGFMANNVLPARAGELARAFVVQRLTKVRFTSAIASLVVERALDGLTIVALLIVAIWMGGFADATTEGGITLGSVANTALALFAFAFVAALAAVYRPQATLGLFSRVATKLLPSRLADWAVRVADGLLAGLDALRSPHRLATASAWSLILWIVNAASFYAGLVAFGIDVPWSAALMVQGIVAFGVAVPSAPGYVGVFELAVRVALVLYGVVPTLAVSYGLAYHVATYIPITILGVWSLATIQMGLRDLTAARDRQADPGPT